MHTSLLTERERWAVVVESAKEVGPTLVFSLLVIIVSFVPVYTLEAQEGRLFKPLAWTRTLAMAAASLLLTTVVPAAIGLFIRGRIHPERKNPVSRVLMALYRPVIDFVLRYRLPGIAAAVATLLLTWIPFQRIGGKRDEAHRGPDGGAMASSTVLTLAVIPAIYSLWKEWKIGREMSREAAATPVGASATVPRGVS